MKARSLFLSGKVRGHATRSRAADRGVLLILVIVGVPTALAIVMAGIGWI